MVCEYQCVFNRLPIKGHLGCFQFFTIMNKGTMNI